MPKPPIVNVDEVELQPRPPQFAATGPAAERYEAKAAMIGMMIGAKKLGYNITALPPGKRAYPPHNHRVNEEMFFILQGSGEVLIGKETYPIRKGDIIACPPGGKETAHQIINTGKEEMRYLAVSTKMYPEVVDYPNSGKFGILADYTEPGGPPQQFRFVGRPEQNVDYWEGE